MWDRLSLITPPAAYAALTLAEAKSHLRIDDNSYDDILAIHIPAAVQFIEGPNGAGVCLSPQTWRLTLDAFPTVLTYVESQIYTIAGMNAGARNAIQIPLGPVTSVSQITYVDTTGTVQTLPSGNYNADIGREPCRITPSWGNSWPVTRIQNGAVKVDFVAGPATPNYELKMAALLLVGVYLESPAGVVFDKKTEELPLGVRSILDKYARGRIG